MTHFFYYFYFILENISLIIYHTVHLIMVFSDICFYIARFCGLCPIFLLHYNNNYSCSSPVQEFLFDYLKELIEHLQKLNQNLTVIELKGRRY